MLSPEQLNIIKEQLLQENAHEFVEKLIMSYATDTNRIGELLKLIPRIADRQLQIVKEQVQEYAFAYDLLLGERLKYKSKNKRYSPDFNVLLYGCKAHFPSGTCGDSCHVDRAFFSEFLDIVRNKVGFDYENEDDWEWICNTADCREWMLVVIKQYIDADFVEPDVRIRSRGRG